MTFDRLASAPIADRARSEILAAGRHPARAVECRARGEPRERVPLGDEHVRSVKADDQRDGPGRGRADDAAGNHPVRVHDRRAFLLRDAQRLEPAGQDAPAERRRPPMRAAGHRRASLRHSRTCSAPARRVVEEMEVDAAIDLRPVPFRMPRRDQMHLVPARRNALRDRLHEAADGVTREPSDTTRPP